MIRIILTVLILSAPATAAIVAQTRPAVPAFRVIVNANNPVSSVDRKFITDVFLKKATRWDHLGLIRPADQRADSAVRAAFSAEILKRPVPAVKTYWQQVVFSGRDVPPPEFESDDHVVKYVLRYPGAIGYVSATADVLGTKVLFIK